MTAGLVVLLLAVLLGWRSSVGATPGAPASGIGTPGQGRAAHQPWCDAPGLPACPSADPNWVSITGETPSAVAAAIARSPMFGSTQSRNGNLTLDVPALVHLLKLSSAAASNASDYWQHDHWVVSARNASGIQVGVFDFVYDRANHRIRFVVYGNLLPGDPRYGHAFPYVPANTAVQLLHAERGLSVAVSVAPELVFFPVATSLGPVPTVPPAAGSTPRPTWTAGGEYATDPVWLVAGVDGKQYVVGTDTHVYAMSQIPFAA